VLRAVDEAACGGVWRRNGSDAVLLLVVMMVVMAILYAAPNALEGEARSSCEPPPTEDAHGARGRLMLVTT
jgi:hypothetical protein